MKNILLILISLLNKFLILKILYKHKKPPMKNPILFTYLLFLFFPILVVSQNPYAKEDNSLRIMSYNVRNGVGMDNITNYQRIADIITEMNPDVVALQELDSATQRSKNVFVLRELAENALMHYTYAPAIDFQGGKYGIGILSKEKPINHRIIPLPGREERRVLLIVEFPRYVVCCTHLSLTEEDRNASVSIIREAIKGYSKPLFLAGDINSNPESELQKSLSETFKTLNNPKENTFPSSNPETCLDYIYGIKNDSYTLLQRRVIKGKLASDHLPLFVDVRIKANQADIFRTRPYLQNPIGNGITVSWLTNLPTHSWVEYGTDKNLENKTETIVDGQVICNNKHHKIRLENLQPGVTYYYRVCSREMTLYEAYRKEFGETAYSDILTFRLPSATETDFTALVFNDLHKNKELLDSLMLQVGGMKYDFVIFNGDFLDDPKNEDQVVDYLSFMNNKAKAQYVPVFYLRGNHEIRNAYSIQMRELFDYVDNKTYNAFNWGDTRFVTLDCGEDKPDSTWVYYNLNNFEQLRKDQATFLKKEINSKEYKEAKKRVLVHHIPIYGTTDDYNPCLELWHPFLKNAPFNVSLNAHTHRFAFHPKGSAENNFPVVVGGGNRVNTGTVMILKKKGEKMDLTALNARGEKLLELDLND